MRVIDLINAEQTLIKFADSTELPISVSYNLLPVLDQIQQIISEFYEFRNKRAEEHKAAEHSKDYLEADLKEYLSKPVDLQFEPVKIQTVAPYVKISMVELSKIRWLFTQ